MVSTLSSVGEAENLPDVANITGEAGVLGLYQQQETGGR